MSNCGSTREIAIARFTFAWWVPEIAGVRKPLKNGHSEHLFAERAIEAHPVHRPASVSAAGNSAITAQLLAAAEMN
jgi:hypothetical protein